MEQVEPAVVDGELSCVECLYDLRGQPMEGVCPECGTAVAASFDDRRLDRADAMWVAKVRWGVALAGGEYVAPVVTYAVVSILPGMAKDLVADLTVGSIGLCAVLGAWLMTAHEPGTPGVGVLARVTRVAGMVATVAILGFMMMIVWHARVSTLTKLVPVTAAAASLVLGLAEPTIMRRLLRRVPGRPATWPTWLSQGASGVTWGIMLLGVGTDLLDNMRWMMLFAMALCVVPPAVAAWVWWTLRVGRYSG